MLNGCHGLSISSNYPETRESSSLFIPKNNVYDVDYVDYVADVGHDSDRCVGF